MGCLLTIVRDGDLHNVSEAAQDVIVTAPTAKYKLFTCINTHILYQCENVPSVVYEPVTLCKTIM